MAKKKERDRRPRGTGRIFTPKGTKILYIQYWQDGIQHRESTQSTLRSAAEAMLRDRLTRKDYGQVPATVVKQTTYADLRKLLIDEYYTKDRKSLQTLADGTETIWPLTAIDNFFGYESESKPGRTFAHNINDDAVQEFIRQRREEGRSDSTILGSLSLLRKMLRLGVKKKLLLEMPVLTLPPKASAREDFIREPQLKLLLKELPAHLHPFVTFLFYQGTRLTEAERITWQQIDLQRCTYSPDKRKTKTGENKLRILHDKTVQALRSIKRGGPSDLVFDTTNLRKYFLRATNQLGLGKRGWVCNRCHSTSDADQHAEPPRCSGEDCMPVPMEFRHHGFSIHGFRRSCVNYYRERGVADSLIRGITGHKDLSAYGDYAVADLAAQAGAVKHAATAKPMLLEASRQG